jgi:hypothetical protein
MTTAERPITHKKLTLTIVCRMSLNYDYLTPTRERRPLERGGSSHGQITPVNNFPDMDDQMDGDQEQPEPLPEEEIQYYDGQHQDEPVEDNMMDEIQGRRQQEEINVQAEIDMRPPPPPTPSWSSWCTLTRPCTSSCPGRGHP